MAKKPDATSEDGSAEIESILKELNKGDQPTVSSGADPALNDLRGYISTGCSVLDAAIGQGKIQGGIPIGRFTELYGPEGVGKTTLTTQLMISVQQGRGVLLEWVAVDEEDTGRVLYLPVVKEAQLKPGLSILIDSEFKWSLDRAQNMGLDPTRMLRVKARTVEEGFEQLQKVVKKVKEKTYFQDLSVPVLVVWDSLGASATAAELEDNALSGGIAEKARLIRSAMRKMAGQLSALNLTVVFTSHEYARIGTPGTDVSGGKGLKYAASLRLQLRKSEPLKEGAREIGIITRVKAAKSSICAPTFEVAIPISFSRGVEDDYATLEFMLANETRFDPRVITKAGAWYYILGFPKQEEKISFQYKGFSTLLESTPGLRDYLLGKIRTLIPS